MIFKHNFSEIQNGFLRLFRQVPKVHLKQYFLGPKVFFKNMLPGSKTPPNDDLLTILV